MFSKLNINQILCSDRTFSVINSTKHLIAFVQSRFITKQVCFQSFLLSSLFSLSCFAYSDFLSKISCFQLVSNFLKNS